MLRYTNKLLAMKKLFVSLFLIMCCVFSAQAQQTKTTYCDVYVRGGAKNQKVTIMYCDKIFNLNNANMAQVLDILGNDGWILDEVVPVQRMPLWYLPLFSVTRHKVHLIMKKEFFEGENPFSLLTDNRRSEIKKSGTLHR